MQDLSLHLLDIAQNSIRAHATEIAITLKEDSKMKIRVLIVEDNGVGMDEETLQNVENPFFTTRTTRKVGLGIPLLKQNCELSGGKLHIESNKGHGTCLTASMYYDHVDCMPKGDIRGTFLLLLRANPQIDWRFEMYQDERMFQVSSKELKQILGDVPIHEPEIIEWLKQYIQQQEEKLVNFL